MLDQQINEFKNVFVSDHKDLINVTTELNKYTKNTIVVDGLYLSLL